MCSLYGGSTVITASHAAAPCLHSMAVSAALQSQVQLDTSLAAIDPGALFQTDFGPGSPPPGQKPKHTAVVIFAFLKSYEHMGKAVFK